MNTIDCLKNDLEINTARLTSKELEILVKLKGIAVSKMRNMMAWRRGGGEHPGLVNRD